MQGKLNLSVKHWKKLTPALQMRGRERVTTLSCRNTPRHSSAMNVFSPRKSAAKTL